MNVQTGREYEGAVSDVTYSFFKNGYLMTTAVFCNLLCRWVPVLCPWIHGLGSDHYHFHAHFTALLQQNSKFVMQQTDIQAVEKKIALFRRLCGTVMDFSQAQREGFIEAFSEVAYIT
jgi:hypothetical protein